MKSLYFNSIIQKYTYLFFIKDKEKIYQVLNKIYDNVTFILINYEIMQNYGGLFFICFNDKLLIINDNDLHEIKSFFLKNQNINLYMTMKACKTFQKFANINIKFNTVNFSEDDISIMKSHFRSAIIKLLKSEESIKSLSHSKINTIIAYLLQKAYNNTRINRKENIELLIQSKNSVIKKFKEDQIIILSRINKESNGSVYTAYEIETEKIIALKNFRDDNEKDKLFEREKKNYEKVHHPFLPKFYGTVKIESNEYLIIEYIEGCQLNEISKLNLSDYEKIFIILEIMFSIKSIHDQNFIYRDLKPSNIIIDTNKTAVLIDFDRMIENNSEKEDIENTVNFGHYYIAPEIINRECFAFKADIYSIGLIINYIFFGEKPSNRSILSFKKFQQNYPELKKICEMCTEIENKERPNINQLIHIFIFDFLLKYINKFNELRHHFTLRSLRIFIEAYKNILLPNDLRNEIYYLKLLSSHNFYVAQYFLANIFKDGQYTVQNINKSIFYLTNLVNCHSYYYLEARNILDQIYKQNHFFYSIKEQFELFNKLINNSYFQKISISLNYILNTFCFYFFIKNDKEIKNILNQKINIEIIFVEELVEINGEVYMIICFDYKLIILQKSELNELHHFFEINKKSQIFIHSQNKIFPEIGLNLIEINEEDAVNIEIHNFMCYFIDLLPMNFNLTYFVILVLKNLGYYLIKKASIISDTNRIIYSFFYYEYQLDKEKLIIDINDIVILNKLSFEEDSRITYLVYHIKNEQILTLHSILSETSENISQKTVKYMKVNNPFLPQFYGTVKIRENSTFFAYEYIYGHSLKYIKKIKLSLEEKLELISQISIAIHFIHQNNYICLNLSPNNIIINQYNNVVLVGLDLIENGSSKRQIDLNFDSIYLDPQISTGNIDFSCDIYSLGLIIYYIIFEKTPNINEIKNNNEIEYIEIFQIIKNCINENVEERKTLLEIIDRLIILNENSIIQMSNFILDEAITYLSSSQKNHYCSDIEYFHGIINYKMFKKEPQMIKNTIDYLEIASNKNQVKAQYKLGKIYINNKYIKIDVNKAFFYLTNSSNRNYPKAQITLGKIYYEGKLVELNPTKAIQYFQLAANNKNKRAYGILGYLHFMGKYVARNVNKAMYYFNCAAEANDIPSQYYLGILYLDGNHIKQDINKAIHYLSNPSVGNHPLAHFYLGYIYFNEMYNKRDISKAIYYFSESAKRHNNVKSQYYLGIIYSEPKFLNYDVKKAIYFLTLSANQNYGPAQARLGVVYYDIDINKSIHYMTLAAEKNLPDAQFNLAYIFCFGKKVQKNIKKAMKYLNLSANRNYSDAKILLAYIYYSGIDCPKDFKKAIYYCKQVNNPNSYYLRACIYLDEKKIDKALYYLYLAAKQNMKLAQYWLGKFYFYGIYEKYDLNKAIYYLNLASDNNYSEAQYLLGIIYYYNRHVMNKKKAIVYFEKSAKLNNKKAQSVLGQFYYNSKNSSDIKRGIFFYAEASKNGDIHGNFSLGYIYHEGKYIKRDIIKAVELYKEASSFNYKYAKNNLGIIYKHGFGDDIKKNNQFAIQYFNEVIEFSNDYVSMYNLANILFYDDTIKTDEDFLFSILIKAAKSTFFYSKELLCLFLMKKFKFDFKLAELSLIQRNDTFDSFISEILNIISNLNLYNEFYFEEQYDNLKNLDFLYKDNFSIISYNIFMIQKENSRIKTDSNKFNITSDFYDGLGLDFE